MHNRCYVMYFVVDVVEGMGSVMETDEMSSGLVSVVWARWTTMSDTNDACDVSRVSNRRFRDKVGTTILHGWSMQ